MRIGFVLQRPTSQEHSENVTDASWFGDVRFLYTEEQMSVTTCMQLRSGEQEEMKLGSSISCIGGEQLGPSEIGPVHNSGASSLIICTEFGTVQRKRPSQHNWKPTARKGHDFRSTAARKEIFDVLLPEIFERQIWRQNTVKSLPSGKGTEWRES